MISGTCQRSKGDGLSAFTASLSNPMFDILTFSYF